MQKAEAMDAGVFCEIMWDIFESMVGLKLVSSKSAKDRSGKGARVAAVVSIGGPNRYAVILEGSEKLACMIASSFSGETYSGWNSKVEDAFAELANITAGNVKASLGERNLMLTVPTVIHGYDFYWSSPKMEILDEVEFLCEGETLSAYLGKEKPTDEVFRFGRTFSAVLEKKHA